MTCLCECPTFKGKQYTGEQHGNAYRHRCSTGINACEVFRSWLSSERKTFSPSFPSFPLGPASCIPPRPHDWHRSSHLTLSEIAKPQRYRRLARRIEVFRHPLPWGEGEARVLCPLRGCPRSPATYRLCRRLLWPWYPGQNWWCQVCRRFLPAVPGNYLFVDVVRESTTAVLYWPLIIGQWEGGIEGM